MKSIYVVAREGTQIRTALVARQGVDENIEWESLSVSPLREIERVWQLMKTEYQGAWQRMKQEYLGAQQPMKPEHQAQRLPWGPKVRMSWRNWLKRFREPYILMQRAMNFGVQYELRSGPDLVGVLTPGGVARCEDGVWAFENAGSYWGWVLRVTLRDPSADPSEGKTIATFTFNGARLYFVAGRTFRWHWRLNRLSWWPGSWGIEEGWKDAEEHVIVSYNYKGSLIKLASSAGQFTELPLLVLLGLHLIWHAPTE